MSSPERAADVLATLGADGSRRWLRPKLARGRYLTARSIVGYILVVFFVAMPFVRIGGHPGIRIDVPGRKLYVLGTIFHATDTFALMAFLISAFTTVFLATALVGRGWCGWACPQTVYLELVYRPLQRLFEGKGYHRGTPTVAARIVTLAVYALISFGLGNVFVAYFMGGEGLGRALFESPRLAPTEFTAMLVTSTLVFLDFAWFREQMCQVACPYARLQSALVDKDSLVVAYDAERGEPRGKPKAGMGDCVDCSACVRACPAGIDIRNGAQLECIQCAQCADACDIVMVKLGKPRALVGYKAPPARRVLRPRVLLYTVIIASAVTSLALFTRGRETFDVTLLRVNGLPYQTLPDGTVANAYRLKIENHGEQSLSARLAIEDLAARLIAEQREVTIAAEDARTLNIVVALPAERFEHGSAALTLKVTAGEAVRDVHLRLIGPMPGATP
ncbi:MAG: cytochrome c oxidase accessory protein CcoG [Myxococcota bacterium]